MRRLLPEEKNIYRLQDYAIIQREDGKYEYVAWEEDKATGALTWIRGIAVIVEEALCLASITSDGKEENIDSRLELKYELGQLPVWEKTKYYCVVLGGMASLMKYSGTGNALKPGSQEFKMAQDMLKKYGIVPPTE
jgi:hypothetical protein